MTAQIVLMNRYGIAIASDSVVSVAHDEDIYQTMSTSEKIIELSGDHDAAFMVSGLVYLNGVPLSVLIWEWSKTIEKKFDTLTEYMNSFLAWLENRQELNSESMNRGTFEELVSTLLSRIWQNTEEYEVGFPISENFSTLEKGFLNAVQEWEKYSKSNEVFAGWDGAFLKEVISEPFEEIITEKINYYFDDRPLSNQSLEVLKNICRSTLWWWKSNSGSELVIVGYGAQDLLPRAEVVTIHGIFDGRIRRSEIESRDTSASGSFYRFFGQWDASVQFIKGIDPALKERIIEHFQELIRNQISSVSLFDEDEGDEDLEELIQDKVRRAASELNNEINSYSQENFVSPLIQVIKMAPQADLSKLAKSLIEIQAIRQSINQITPTVGGPIDVAVISKRHGFQWVAHKSIS